MRNGDAKSSDLKQLAEGHTKSAGFAASVGDKTGEALHAGLAAGILHAINQPT